MKLLLLFIFLSLPLVAQAKKQSIEINFELSHNKKAPIKFKVITRAGQEAQISNHLRGVEETRITATPTVDVKGHLTLDMTVFKSFKGIPVKLFLGKQPVLSNTMRRPARVIALK